jgi:hypothetical protein
LVVEKTDENHSFHPEKKTGVSRNKLTQREKPRVEPRKRRHLRVGWKNALERKDMGTKWKFEAGKIEIKESLKMMGTGAGYPLVIQHGQGKRMSSIRNL